MPVRPRSRPRHLRKNELADSGLELVRRRLRVWVFAFLAHLNCRTRTEQNVSPSARTPCQVPSCEDQGPPTLCLTVGNRLVTIIGNQMVSNRRKQRDVVFRAIADPTRREILSLLRRRRHTVGEISENFSMSRPAISKHLRLLRSAGLVVSRREGTASWCSLNAKPLRAIDDWLRDYETFWVGTMQGLKSYVEKNS
jgi:DNA-binding transcriptional ArsR family regulator